MADYGMLLRDQVVLKYRSLDRIVLQEYVLQEYHPKLASGGQVWIFLRWNRRVRIPPPPRLRNRSLPPNRRWFN
jgi:hypothetical protein